LIRHSPSVRAPGFRTWIDFGRFNPFATNRETVAVANADDFIGQNATVARLLEYRGASLSRDLPVVEPIVTKTGCEWPVGTAFLPPQVWPQRLFGHSRWVEVMPLEVAEVVAACS